MGLGVARRQAEALAPLKKGRRGEISHAEGNPKNSREGGVSFLIESGRSDQEIREKPFRGNLKS